MQGVGDLAIDGQRLGRVFEVSQGFFGGLVRGGLAKILLLGCTAGLIFILCFSPHGDEHPGQVAPFPIRNKG